MNEQNGRSPVAGWYTNPENKAQLRFWDGAEWTDQIESKEQCRNETSIREEAFLATIAGLRLQLRKAYGLAVAAFAIAIVALVVGILIPGPTGPAGPVGEQGIQGEQGPIGQCAYSDKVDVVTGVRLEFIGDFPRFFYDTVTVCKVSPR